jgi:predicted RecB family endonuclease
VTRFDPDALRPMILERKGDVGALADDLAVDSEELRNFIMSTPTLRRALDEVIARGVDQAIRVLFKGLDDDEHFMNQLAASKEFLKSRAAQRRGFHHAGDLELKMPSKGGALTLTWLSPEDSRKPEPPLIEGHVENDE